jgi:hypothetical protein
MRIIRLRWICFLAALTTCAWAQTEGTIRGTVLDEKGNALAGARVHLERTDINVVHSSPRFVETDSRGGFVIQRVPWGSYEVLAGKEEAGYPDTLGNFYRNGPPPTAVLTRLTASAEVTIQLGPKAATLKLASVTDATTGKDLSVTGVITVGRANTPHSSLQTSTTQQTLLVPSLTPVSVRIAVPGYKTWPAENQPERVVNLQPGEVLGLQARLVPEGPNPMVTDLLMELGKARDKIFTWEEAWGSGQDSGSMRTYRFPYPQKNASLTKILDEMSRVVPNFTYRLDSRNPRIIHVIDRRLAGQQRYSLDNLLDRIDFSGPVYGLIRAIADKNGPISAVQTPGPYDLVDVDLSSNISLHAESLSARDALSEITPAKGEGGILWMAGTQLGDNNPTVLTFCCAPRPK